MNVQTIVQQANRGWRVVLQDRTNMMERVLDSFDTKADAIKFQKSKKCQDMVNDYVKATQDAEKAKK